MTRSERMMLQYIHLHPAMFDNVPDNVLESLENQGYVDLLKHTLTEKGKEWNYALD